MSTSINWKGELTFECETECKCEEMVKGNYAGTVCVDDTPIGGDRVRVDDLVETHTTYSVKSLFEVRMVGTCVNCGMVCDGDVKCQMTYNHPITCGKKAMVVVMNGAEHQVVSMLFESNA